MLRSNAGRGVVGGVGFFIDCVEASDLAEFLLSVDALKTAQFITSEEIFVQDGCGLGAAAAPKKNVSIMNSNKPTPAKSVGVRQWTMKDDRPPAVKAAGGSPRRTVAGDELFQALTASGIGVPASSDEQNSSDEQKEVGQGQKKPPAPSVRRTEGGPSGVRFGPPTEVSVRFESPDAPAKNSVEPNLVSTMSGGLFPRGNKVATIVTDADGGGSTIAPGMASSGSTMGQSSLFLNASVFQPRPPDPNKKEPPTETELNLMKLVKYTPLKAFLRQIVESDGVEVFLWLLRGVKLEHIKTQIFSMSLLRANPVMKQLLDHDVHTSEVITPRPITPTID